MNLLKDTRFVILLKKIFVIFLLNLILFYPLLIITPFFDKYKNKSYRKYKMLDIIAVPINIFLLKRKLINQFHTETS
jgi:hypothetical protein